MFDEVKEALYDEINVVDIDVVVLDKRASSKTFRARLTSRSLLTFSKRPSAMQRRRVPRLSPPCKP